MATIDWTAVEEAEKENTISGYKVAVLEAAKLLENRLKEEHVPGANTKERLAAGKLHFTRPADLKKAYDYVENLRTGHTGALTIDRAKTYLQSFRQGVADLNDLSQSRSSKVAQLKLYYGLVLGKQRWLINTLIGIAAFLVAVLLLANTTLGNLLVVGVVTFVNTFFKWLIILVIGLALVAVAVVSTAIYLDRRGGRVTTEDDEH
jgi:hypothetical protein